MSAQRFLQVLLMIFLLMIPACTGTEDKEQSLVFKQVPEIQEIKSRKPVKIKLKRNTNGEYSWDISGDNTDEIIKTDKRLKEYLEKKNLATDSHR